MNKAPQRAFIYSLRYETTPSTKSTGKQPFLLNFPRKGIKLPS
jgi:hypothetical protein